MVSCLMGDSTALASAIVRCCLKIVQWYRSFRHFYSPYYILLFTFPFGYVYTIHSIGLNTSYYSRFAYCYYSLDRI